MVTNGIFVKDRNTKLWKFASILVQRQQLNYPVVLKVKGGLLSL